MLTPSTSRDWRPDPKLGKAENACNIWFCPAQERTARELKCLPRQQREKVWADLSGDKKVSLFEINPEEEDFVANCLKEMQMEIDHIPEKAAFNLALKRSPDYVNRRSFRLMFLRADQYDPKAAAVRIIRHFEEKQKLFGDELLGRDVRLDDLNEDALAVLTSGGLQELCQTDQGGRQLQFCRSSLFKYKTQESMVRNGCWSLEFM